jgi:hypothetical protein
MAEEKEEGTDNSADGAVRYGISTGLREILENHPDLIRYGDVLGGHIDGQKFGAEKNRIFTETNEAARNGKFASKYIMLEHVYEEIAKVVASGTVFDDVGTRALLEGGLAEIVNKGFFVGGARPEQEKRTKLDDIMEANSTIYGILKSEEYDPRKMPELIGAVETVQRMGVWGNVVDVLKDHGLMDEEKYYAIKTEIEKRAIGIYDAVKANIPNYISQASKKEGETEVTDITKKTKQKVAASILGILGLGILIATKTAVTGGVIGALPSSSRFIGAGLLVVSLVWMWKVFSRNKK